MIMKKSIVFLLFATAFLLSSCEQPEGPQSLIGHWNMVGDHWTATFDDEGELYISSTKYDTGLPFYYTATADSLYIYTISYADGGMEPSDSSYGCSYTFQGSSVLVINGFNAIFQNQGSIADKIKTKERVTLTRTPSFR
jgi:hypothetical protein